MFGRTAGTYFEILVQRLLVTQILGNALWLALPLLGQVVVRHFPQGAIFLARGLGLVFGKTSHVCRGTQNLSPIPKE